MDADDIDEALSDLLLKRPLANGSNTANQSFVALVASPANINLVATNTTDPNRSAATAIVAQGTTNPPARHNLSTAAPREPKCS